MFFNTKFLSTLLLTGMLIPTYNALADEVVVTPPLKPVIQNDVIDALKVYYISTENVRVRASAEDSGKTLGLLSLNDKIRLVNPGTVYLDKYIEVTIVRTSNEMNKSEHYYINKNYISPTEVTYKKFEGKHFVVVNVATETLRLYERVCADNSCPHKMLLETEVVAGEDVDHPKEEKGKGRSILGSYRVIGWTKFYEDSTGHYPSWYKDGYPAVPTPDASGRDWFSKKFMPLNDQGKPEGHMRGAFGWYTAFVEPEAFGQWTHGTIGWGSDKDKFIKMTKSGWLNFISNPRSSGCTRNNNEAIAYIREFVEVGTPIIKIYAQEALLDQTLANYPEQQNVKWNYILTKNRGQKSDRMSVMKELKVADQDVDSFAEAKKNGGETIIDPKSPLSQILEVGTYDLDTHPDVIVFTPKEKLHGKLDRATGRKGNVYGLKTNEMHGTFYVDAGILSDYKHPDRVLESSGFADETTPPWMNGKNIQK